MQAAKLRRMTDNHATASHLRTFAIANAFTCNVQGLLQKEHYLVPINGCKLLFHQFCLNNSHGRSMVQKITKNLLLPLIVQVYTGPRAPALVARLDAHCLNTQQNPPLEFDAHPEVMHMCMHSDP